jgi:glyoxylase-like metal-dependent hydrolase (beta-lactamase superfamily II)
MKTKKGTQIYQVLSGRNNVHLIHHHDKWILVDTGMTRFYKKLKHRLQKLLPPNAPLTIFLTHTHYDHCQNARALQKDFNCKIIAPKNEALFLKSGRTPLPKGTNIYEDDDCFGKFNF